METNYDTDGDGKLDLVKALVQIPRAAAEGSYKAATIYEARPYITGCTELYGYEDGLYVGGDYDIASMYSTPTARTQAGTTNTMTAAAQADSADWYYWNPEESMMDYEDLEWYDYYLVRGFAVVECGGLGTKGSEGFETCGTDLEIDAFKCVIEWLHGDRVAYTDKTSNIAISADWSNGKVGMTGRSYAGTTQFGLATTGVAGLETIVPVAGIASWYEYTNSQGVSTRSNTAYSDALAGYCAGRKLDADDWNSIKAAYGNYLYTIYNLQKDLNGDYGEHWAIRDYTANTTQTGPIGETGPRKISCSALIVHGQNDYNVRPKEFELMYNAFQSAGQDVKIILHQDGHLTPTYPAGGLVFDIGSSTYDEILNKWFSHYLYGEDNGIDTDLAAVTAQDSHNTDVWNEYTSYDTTSALTVTGTDTPASGVDISSAYSDLGVTRSNYQAVLSAGSTPYSAMFAGEVTADTTIKGTTAVSFQASTGAAEAGKDALMVSAMLVDIAPEGETFPAFNTAGSYVRKTTLGEGAAWMGGGLKNFDLTKLNTSDVSYKVITRGWMDLANPDAGFDSATAARTNKIDLGDDTAHSYTIYLQPTVYEVEAGHTLALVIYSYEPGMANYKENYTFTLVSGSVSANVPVDGTSSSLTAAYTAQQILFNATTSSREGGSITSSVANGAVGSGTEVTVTAKANSGYAFTGWTVNGQDAGTDETLTLTITASASVVAKFEKLPASGTSKVQETRKDAEESAASKRYSDVDGDEWYAEAVDYVTENGLMNGTNGKFNANDNVSRAMLVTLLYRLEGSPAVSQSVSFTDVASGSWYDSAVRWAVSAGIVKGVSAASFAPNASITREQLAAMLCRYAAYKGYDVASAASLTGYTDASTISAYAANAIAWACSEGLLTGRTASTIAPQGTASRAEAAVILMRFAQSISE